MSLKRHWPAIVAVATYWIALAVVLKVSTRLNDGHLVYPVDDAYVHMSIAKNVALHHVWGVTRYGFASATSSPLWTLLLALTYATFGVSAVAPLVFNIAAGTLVVVTTYRFMQARSASASLTLVVLMTLIFVTPLPTLTLAGMEHTLHALVTLWLAFAAASLLASNVPLAPKDVTVVGLLSALVVGFRYEGIFTVSVVALLFLATRRLLAAAIVAAMGALPIVAYGLWSLRHGWYFLPNSVLLKGQTPSLEPRALLPFLVGSPALHNLLAYPHVLLLVVAALAALLVVLTASGRHEDVFLLTILIGTTLLHLQLARIGWFYRYESYLLVLGTAVLGVFAAGQAARIGVWTCGRPAFPRYAAACTLLIVAGFPFASRGVNALRNMPAATANIYQQQYQMGRFVDRFYRGQSIALNDIGAVTYLADVRLLDIYGLASRDMARLRIAGRFDSKEVAASADAEGTAVAIVYPSWLGEYGGMPSRWTKVGEWGVRDNVVLGESSVSFYAVKDGERLRLAENLRRFASALPSGVVQLGEYTAQP